MLLSLHLAIRLNKLDSFIEHRTAVPVFVARSFLLNAGTTTSCPNAPLLSTVAYAYAVARKLRSKIQETLAPSSYLWSETRRTVASTYLARFGMSKPHVPHVESSKHKAASQQRIDSSRSMADKAVRRFRDAFDAFDENGDGIMQVSELRALLLMVGGGDPAAAPDERALRRMVASVATDGRTNESGHLNWKTNGNERMENMKRRQVPRGPGSESEEEDLENLFREGHIHPLPSHGVSRYHDRSHSGVIDGTSGSGHMVLRESGGVMAPVAMQPVTLAAKATAGAVLSLTSDADGDSMTFEHFLRFVTSYLQVDEEELPMKQVFQVFDVDGSGAISVAELAKVLNRDFGMAVTHDEVEAMVSIADDSNDGELSLREFRNIYAKVKLGN
jgi:Ca2+-binding EF-hand superfamily protein